MSPSLESSAGRPVLSRATVSLWATTIASVVGLVALFAVLPLTGGGRLWGAGIGLLASAAVVPVLVHRVRAVLRAEHPLAAAVSAVIVTATLIVLGAAATYYGMASADPDQFMGLETRIDAVYFAVVVLSTVGFGDIAPTGQAARLVTTLHILVDIVLLGGAVRLLTWAARRRIGHEGGAGDGTVAGGPA